MLYKCSTFITNVFCMYVLIRPALFQTIYITHKASLDHKPISIMVFLKNVLKHAANKSLTTSQTSSEIYRISFFQDINDSPHILQKHPWSRNLQKSCGFDFVLEASSNLQTFIVKIHHKVTKRSAISSQEKIAF